MVPIIRKRMMSACAMVAIAFTLVMASGSYYLFRSPFSNGAMQHGAMGNPVLLLSPAPPDLALQASFVPVSAGWGNDQLVIPDPTGLINPNLDPGYWFAHLLVESFDLRGLTPREVTARMEERLPSGIDLFLDVQIPYGGYCQKWNNGTGLQGRGLYAATQIKSSGHIPGQPLLVVFSPTYGLQPGNTIDFESFTTELQIATRVNVAYARQTHRKVFSDYRLAWAVMPCFMLGHSLFKMELADGFLAYSQENVLSVSSKGKILTTGTGLHHQYKVRNPLKDALINGTGMGVTGSVLLTSGQRSFSAGLMDVGLVRWHSLRQAEISLTGDSLYLVNIASDRQALKIDMGTFRYLPPKNVALPTSLLLEASQRRDSPETELWQLLSAYQTVVLGLQQPLIRDMSLPMTPLLGFSAENGFYKGKLPLRLGWTFGGINKVTSFVEVDHVAGEMSYALYYRSLGDAFLRNRKGIELGMRVHLLFGFPKGWDDFAPSARQKSYPRQTP